MISPNKLNDLPFSPGCYLFRNSKGEIIYVGKAKSIRKRVSSYFQKTDHDAKTTKLVSEIINIDFIATSTEIEALLLENNLIKKHYPRYNIDLKDSQKYAYIHLTNSELPWIEVERARTSSGEFYGPFVSGAIRKQIYDLLSRNFKILTRKPSPNIKKLINREEYLQSVDRARKILGGDVDSIISEIKKEMQSASKNTYFEYAMTLRNQINALESLKEKQLIEFTRAVDAHIIDYLVSNEIVYLLVFSIRKGVLEGKQEFIFERLEDFFEEFLLRYYDSNPIPQQIILREKIDQSVVEYLSKKRGKKVEILVPEIGDKKQLLELVKKNILANFFSGREKLEELKTALDLTRLPSVMECFDISHLGGTNTVASMVCFKDGVPDKDNYRRYKILTAQDGDDYAAMREVLKRRYSKIVRENLRKPDLIVIDGGLGQLNEGIEVLRSLDLKIPVISLAKRLEEIYLPNKEEPLFLKRDNKGLLLLQAIRDEAHRFANSYQAILRRKQLIGK